MEPLWRDNKKKRHCGFCEYEQLKSVRRMSKGKHDLLQQEKERFNKWTNNRSDGVLPRRALCLPCHGLPFFPLPLCLLHEEKDFDFGGFEIFSAFFSAYTKTPYRSGTFGRSQGPWTSQAKAYRVKVTFSLLFLLVYAWIPAFYASLSRISQWSAHPSALGPTEKLVESPKRRRGVKPNPTLWADRPAPWSLDILDFMA